MGDKTEGFADTRQQLKMFEQEVARLPHKLKTALILFAVEGNSQENCAQLLNTTPFPKAIEARVYRVRKILTGKLTLIF